MYKRILSFVVFIILILSISGAVYGSEVQKNSVSYKKLSIQEDKTSNIVFTNSTLYSASGDSGTFNKIQKITKSKSVFKAGTKITLKVYVDKSIKSVSGSIYGKNRYKFSKTKSGYWHYKLNTKGFKTGDYKVNIKAIDNKRKAYKSLTYLTVDNIPPRIYAVSTNVKTINAGEPFTVSASADNSTKKVVASIRGKNYSFKYLNDTHWHLDVKLSYKEIKNVIILVSAHDSVGNIAKKDTYIESRPRVVYWQGNLLTNKKYRVSYPNPTNAYERSIKLLTKYATVYEGYAGDHYTLGITYRTEYAKKIKYSVTIAYKDPFVVYHELAHVLHWNWGEYNCDWYAYNRTGYWIK